MPEFRADHCRAGPCGIDMDVEPVFARDRHDRRQIVHRTDSGAADTGDNAGRLVTGGYIFTDGGVERRGVHAAVFAGHRNAAEVVFTDPGDPDGAVDGCMDFARAIDAQRFLAGEAGFVAVPGKRLFTHGQHGGERRRGSRILDHASEAFRQADRLAQPVEHHRFHLGRGGRGLPQHALRRYGGDEIFRQNRCGRGVCREIGEKARMLPVGDTGHHDGFEIGEDRVHRFGGVGRRGRQSGGDLAGFCLRAHGAVPQALMIGDRPVGDLAAPFCEIAPAHGNS